ncbi:class I SAM-dependent methyltransferase [Gimesia algae]|uniref:16S ribosomal RNA methyltransferase KsgA/Dim1 family protein n=1 Tax=Gimesia algae TaxID=2527971 RepID=A0A517VJU4_9PLAN|nr:methyltransferase domain-containing protein [Gimesia algae]QDT93301.1 16S ribosomal RNA methyltransferase KsgA/Dim1 family protein [Gimesia algae]
MSSTQLSAQESPSRSSAIPCFLRGFLENPLQVASFVPSSGYLQRKLSSLACLQTARCVVELGPGTGETTKALLNAMPADSQLLCVEVVSEFVARLQKFDDPRLTIVENSALALKSILQQQNFVKPDVIVSGVPFSVMSPEEGRQLIETIHQVLAPGGAFVTYQFRNNVCELAAGCFGAPQSRDLVFWNLPPLDLYLWEKTVETKKLKKSPASPLKV